MNVEADEDRNAHCEHLLEEGTGTTRAFHAGITILAATIVLAFSFAKTNTTKEGMTPAQYQAGASGPEASEP